MASVQLSHTRKEQAMSTGEQSTATEIGRFSDIEATAEVERFITFLEHVERLPPAVEVRQRSYEFLQAHAGDAVVDVGCGTGRVVAELADRGLRATGIDISAQM